MAMYINTHYSTVCPGKREWKRQEYSRLRDLGCMQPDKCSIRLCGLTPTRNVSIHRALERVHKIRLGLRWSVTHQPLFSPGSHTMIPEASREAAELFNHLPWLMRAKRSAILRSNWTYPCLHGLTGPSLDRVQIITRVMSSKIETVDTPIANLADRISPATTVG